MSIRSKAILSVVLIFVILASVFLAMSIRQQKRHLHRLIEDKGNAARFLADNLQEQSFAPYRKRIVSLATTKKKVIAAFARRDREALFRACNLFYRTIKGESRFFHVMHFHLPDNTSFLRMHMPERYGDDLSDIRPLVRRVNETRKPLSGYEVGRLGLFYRVVQPVFHQGEYVGALEFGIRYEQLVELLKEQISPNVAVAVKSANWAKADWLTDKPLDSGEYTLLPLGSSLFRSMQSDLELAGHEKRLHVGERHYSLLPDINLLNHEGEPVAKVLLALDVTGEIKQSRRFVINIVILILVVIVLASLVLYFSFSRLLNTIVNLNESLRKANDELENRVEERTRELADANVVPKKEIEERQRLEADLRQAQKMEAIGTLAGGIAHDFNNMLTSILGYAELARDGQDREEAASYLDKVIAAGERARDLVMQILTFSRQKEDKKEAVDIGPLIKEGLKLIRASLPANIEIKTELASSCPPVLADPTQIHQVLMNLCTNAYHAMQASGGELTISLVEDHLSSGADQSGLSPGDYLLLQVSDTGCGMDPDKLDRIFEPYYTTKQAGKGTGLGLAVVHGIVHSCQGHIRVESTPGAGTTFTVYLPCYEGEEGEATGGQEEGEPVGGKGEHILIVDDEPDIVSFLKVKLEDLGYKVTAETDSLRAFDWFALHPDEVDLVVTDLSMPELSGPELTEKIRSLRAEVPVVLCSGFVDMISAEELEKKRIYSILKKPFNVYQMSVVIRSALESRKNQGQ